MRDDSKAMVEEYGRTIPPEGKPEYFRWHVSGDVPDQYYALNMWIIAILCPETKFLVYTKQTHYFDGLDEDNLTMRQSMWPGWGTRDERYPAVWMQDGTETRMPKYAIQCKGKCDQCYKCWNLTRDVVIQKH